MKRLNNAKNRCMRWISVCLIIGMLSALMPLNASAASLSKYETVIFTGKSFTLKASAAARWSSSNTAVATVNSQGVVYGRGVGSCNITATFSNGSHISCRVSCISPYWSKYLSNAQMVVMARIIGAVESGGQVYGQRNYAAFAGPGENSPTEYSSTAGAYQEYGDNLRQLLYMIRLWYPRYFKSYDNAGVEADLKRYWTDSSPYRVFKGSAKAKAIVNIISKGSGARKAQDLRCFRLVDTYLAHARKLGVRNVRAALFLAECEHLGGASSVERIVRRATDKNSIKALYQSLILDQKDLVSNYQIGDTIYMTRHKKCYEWIVKTIYPNELMK